MGAVVIWAVLSFAVFKPQHVSLLHLIIWGQLMVVNVILFIVSFIVSVLNFYRLRQVVDSPTRRVLRRRIVWTLPGLCMALLLLGLVMYLVISVAQALFTVR
jgi:putative copper export protein